jgi:uncharacterized RDD family membrane protein YckC
MVLALLYGAALEGSPWRATIGKRLLGLIVVDACGHRLSALRAGVRSLGKLLSLLTCGIGYAVAAWDPGRSLHDRIAETLVLRCNIAVPTVELNDPSVAQAPADRKHAQS